MKKIYLVMSVLLASTTISEAQITINQSDLPVVGFAFVTAQDDNYVASIPAGGANQTWNYSGLLNLNQDTVAFFAAAGTPYAAQFPTANLATYSPSDGSYSYFSSNSTGFYQNGISDSGVTGGFISFNPANLFIPVPFTYNSTRTSNSRAVIEMIDSSSGTPLGIRISHNVTSNFVCDGWGTLILPNGTHNNTLRVQIAEHANDSLFVDLTGLGFYTLFGADTATLFSYRWVTNGPAAYLLGIEADSVGTTSVSSEYLLNHILLGTNQVSAADNGVFVYPNPAAGEVNFKWNSSLNPTGLVLSDALGRRVMNVEMQGMSKLALPVSGLPNGIYYYQLKLDNGTMEKGKFVISH